MSLSSSTFIFIFSKDRQFSAIKPDLVFSAQFFTSFKHAKWKNVTFSCTISTELFLDLIFDYDFSQFLINDFFFFDFFQKILEQLEQQ